jgi:hypothetical protein
VFLNRLKIACALLLVVLLGTGAALRKAADEQPPAEVRPQHVEAPGDAPEERPNAALHYGQAFLAMRRVGEQEKLNAECLTMPLDAQARAIVTRGAYALRMMQRGAALLRCDWAIDFERGIDLPATPGDGALILSSLACLRARLRFAEGHNAEAGEDIVAALTLARHVTRTGTLDSLWAGHQIEQRTSEALALSLPKLDTRIIKDLRTRLDGLPPGGSVSAATLRMEEAMLNWIVGEVTETRDRESLLVFLSQLGVGPKDPEKRRAEGRTFLEECGGTAAGVLEMAEKMRRASGPLAKKLDLPPDQATKEFEREATKLAGNPVFRVFAPVLDNVRSRQSRAEVRRALLAAALAVQLDGRDALKKHADPTTGGAFEYVAFEGGFELRSKLKDQDDKLVMLIAGRRDR